MAENSVDVIVRARDEATAAIKKIQGELKSLEATAESTGKTTKNVNTDFKGLDDAASAAAGGISGLASAMGAAGFAALGAQIVNTVSQLTVLGAAVQQQEDAFAMMAGQAGASGQAMLQAMRTASQGTVSDMSLMQSANRAMILGVADSAGELSTLLEIAAARAKVMGMSTAAAFSDIVTGIGRGSPLILDNLGITVDLQAAYDRYAASLGITTSMLDETQKKQALLNEVMRSSQDIVSNAKNAPLSNAQKLDQLGASWANFQGEAGKATTDFATPWAEMFTKALDMTTGVISEENRLLADLRDAQLKYAYAVQTGSSETKYWADVIAYTQGELDKLRGGLDTTQQATLSADIAGKQYGYTLDGVSEAAKKTTTDLQWMAIAAESSRQAMAESIALGQQMRRQADAGAASIGTFVAGKQGGDAGLARQKAVSDELARQRDLWYDQGYTTKQIVEVLQPAYIANLNEAERATYRVQTGTVGISDAAREAQSQFDELKGRVQGVLSGALNVDVGVNPDNFLPRQDAVNENARRLADIMVNGFKDQSWLEEFKREVPDVYRALVESGDPQGAAAQMFRDFQDGLRPDLLDKGKAKELVRRAILGDQTKEAWAAEIAAELSAELGAAAPANMEALAKQVLGGTGGLVAGTIDMAGAQIDETQAGALGAQFKQAMLAGFVAAPGDFATPLLQAIAVGMATSNLALPITQSLMTGFMSADAVSGLTVAGGWMAGYVEAGFATANPAANLVDGFVTVFRDSQARIRDAGTAAGAAWGEGFLGSVNTSVPSQLIGLLVTLVTPGVMAQFTARNSLLGAAP